MFGKVIVAVVGLYMGAVLALFTIEHYLEPLDLKTVRTSPIWLEPGELRVEAYVLGGIQEDFNVQESAGAWELQPAADTLLR